MNAIENREKTSLLGWFVAVLIAGNLTSSRGFSHLGVSPLYIGELALAGVLVWQFRVFLSGWILPLFRPSLLSGPAWGISAFLAYGLLQGIRGTVIADDPIAALMCVPFHFYPLFFFVGFEVGVRHPRFLQRFVYGFAWLHGIYGMLYIFVFSPLGWNDASLGTGIAWFSQPYGPALVLLGLLSFQATGPSYWLSMMLNFFVLIGVQVRAEWLSFMASFGLWSVLTGRVVQAVQIGAALFLLTIVALVTDLKVAAPEGRGGEISVRGIVGRSVAAIDPKLAESFLDDPERFASTVSWRTEWWKKIVRESHYTYQAALLGLGYGFPIWELHPEGVGDGLRTPHSIAVWVLGYTGWVGVAVYGLFQLSLALILWRTFRRTGQIFGFLAWVLINIWACSDNLLEAPYGAIPFYLLLGLAAAPLYVVAANESSS